MFLKKDEMVLIALCGFEPSLFLPFLLICQEGGILIWPRAVGIAWLTQKIQGSSREERKLEQQGWSKNT